MPSRGAKRRGDGGEEGCVLVEHLVVVKLKPTTTREAADELLASIRSLRHKIPGILDLQCGWNFSPGRDHGFHIGIRVRFADRAALAAYGPHPEHQPVSARLRELSEDLLAIDFEC